MSRRIAPTKLSNWPWVVVRLDCALCTRKGCYRLARLAARYGPEQSMDGLLRELCQDCPWFNERPRKYEPQCGARFMDLDHALPPPDHPEEPNYRQRQPGREDVPKQPKSPDTSPIGPSLPRSLAAWTFEEVGYYCRRCGKRETFAKAAMLATYGDLSLDPLLEVMAKGCLRWGNTQIYELCGAMFIAPWDKK